MSPTCISKVVPPTTLEDAGGNMLIVDAPEVEFPKQSGSTYFVKSAATEGVSLPTSDLRDCIAFEFALTPEVAFVYTALRSNEIFYAWIVIDEFDRAVRMKIYERQREIIDEFPMFQFDFYVIGLDGRNVDDLIGDPSMHLTYRRD